MAETGIMEQKVSLRPMCPSCERPMEFQENVKTWRCLACNPIPLDAPICATQKCKKPLTRLGPPWNCWICLNCNTHPAKVSKQKTAEPERKYIDKTLTEERVSEMIKKEMAGIGDIVRDTIAEFNIKPDDNDPDYPPTHAEIDAITQLPESNTTIKPENWRDKARRLGVKLFQRKKEDVLADCADIEAGLTKTSLVGDNNVHP